MAGNGGNGGKNDILGTQVFSGQGRQEMAGRVYFLQGVDGGPIKIGFTSGDAEHRLKAIQSGSPVKLLVLGTILGDRSIEKKLHRRFRKLRLHNEWFRDHETIRKFLTSPIAIQRIHAPTKRRTRAEILLHDRQEFYEKIARWCSWDSSSAFHAEIRDFWKQSGSEGAKWLIERLFDETDENVFDNSAFILAEMAPDSIGPIDWALTTGSPSPRRAECLERAKRFAEMMRRER